MLLFFVVISRLCVAYCSSTKLAASWVSLQHLPRRSCTWCKPLPGWWQSSQSTCYSLQWSKAFVHDSTIWEVCESGGVSPKNKNKNTYACIRSSVDSVWLEQRLSFSFLTTAISVGHSSLMSILSISFIVARDCSKYQSPMMISFFWTESFSRDICASPKKKQIWTPWSPLLSHNKVSSLVACMLFGRTIEALCLWIH